MSSNREPTGERDKSGPSKGLRAGVAIFVGLALIGVMVCGVWLWAIQPERQPGCPRLRLWFGLRDKCEFDREFSADVLLVDETFFPVEVELTPIESATRYEIELAVIEISPIDCLDYPADCNPSYSYADHEISRWITADVARSRYLDALSRSFNYESGPHFVPEDLDYQSPVAEHFRVACSDSGPWETCHAVGQYQDYVSVFGARISPTFMTHSDFSNILVKIDERMAEYLELEE